MLSATTFCSFVRELSPPGPREDRASEESCAVGGRGTNHPGSRAEMFYHLWNNGDDGWSRHCVSIYDAKVGGVPHDIDALGAAVADGVTWRAAFECQLVDESHALLPYDLHTPIYIVIAACMSIQNIATAQTTNPKAASLNTKPNIRGRRRNIAPPRTHVTATT